MTIEDIIDSKTKTMTDLSGKETKVLYLKDESEIEAFKQQLLIHSVVVNEANWCEDCQKPIRMTNNTLQLLCECKSSEVEVLQKQEPCPKCNKLCTGRSCKECQQYW